VTDDPIFDDSEVPLLDIAQRDLIEAALVVLSLTGGRAFKVKVPNTTPPIYVVAGEADQIQAESRGLESH
jgi:hypothetical protein